MTIQTSCCIIEYAVELKLRYSDMPIFLSLS
jgi:hypothetical protein